MLFEDIQRTDASPRRSIETPFQFLDRSARPYFAEARRVLEEWVSHVPAEHRVDLVHRMRKDDSTYASAFWELYLHEGYLRSGYDIEIHPTLEHSPNRPDFRIGGPGGPFYLEAVCVGESDRKVGRDRRLKDVHQILTELQIQNFILSFDARVVGSTPLATKRLRKCLVEWVGALNPFEVSEGMETSADGCHSPHRLRWTHAGWELNFTALPLDEENRGTDRSSIGTAGSGGGSDNTVGIRRVLSKKHGRYGRMDAPLVLAVTSNTEPPTRPDEFDSVFYGLSARRSADTGRDPSDHDRDGFWYGSDGWRRSDTPQIITSTGLQPWSVASNPTQLWRTLEDDIPMPAQPSWLHPVVAGTGPDSSGGEDLAAHFGLDPEWATRSSRRRPA